MSSSPTAAATPNTHRLAHAPLHSLPLHGGPQTAGLLDASAIPSPVPSDILDGPEPSPLPEPSPEPEPEPEPPAVSIVTAALLASGDVSDYDRATQNVIQAAIASEAGVAFSAVSLDISAGSVIITATIAVPAAQAASSVDALTAGIFSNPSAMQAALSLYGMVGITVEAIQTAPMTVSSLSPESSPSPEPSPQVLSLVCKPPRMCWSGCSLLVDDLKAAAALL